jgi:hypothetical protein
LTLLEDQGDLIGTADVQVVTDDLLEEHPSGERAVEHLGEGELGLENGDVVAVAGPAVLRGEGMGQASQPLAGQAVDLLGAEPVTDALEVSRVRTGGEAVVEGLEVDVRASRLALGPFVPVDAELGVVGEVGAELDEERAGSTPLTSTGPCWQISRVLPAQGRSRRTDRSRRAERTSNPIEANSACL